LSNYKKGNKKLKEELQEYAILDRFVKEENEKLKMQSAKLWDEMHSPNNKLYWQAKN
jgi:hypothetical protein